MAGLDNDGQICPATAKAEQRWPESNISILTPYILVAYTYWSLHDLTAI